jgi:GTP-binding protein SAR1
LGGHKAARKAWKNYFPKVDGIIYMVDSVATERFEESKTELDAIL